MSFAGAIAAIDERNAGDPNMLLVRGSMRPKELAHAELVTEWIARMHPDASEVLLLAARAHHVKRWVIPRDQYPKDRANYLKWRRALQDIHAAELRGIMERESYPTAEIERAEHILRRRDLANDPDSQALEDAICLTFLETQFHALATELDQDKMIGVLRKTMRKMSAQAKELALGLVTDQADRDLLLKAATPSETQSN